LETFSNLAWADISAQTTGSGDRHKKHHDMDISQICREAQNRWQEIGLFQYDTIFRFRLSGTQRIWGYRILRKFWLVWWDPIHKIYPLDNHQ
jgi:hypothetical protein